MSSLIPLSPILVLLIGAGVSLIPIAIPRYRVLVFLLSALVSSILLLLNYRAGTEPLDVFGPNIASPNLGLVLRFDNDVMLFALVLFIFLSSHVLIHSGSFQASESFGLMIVLAGALTFLLAYNVATLGASWLLIDFGLVILPLERDETFERRLRAFAVSLVGLACWLVAGILAVDDSASLRFGDLVLVKDAAAMAFVSVWFRTGAWPLQVTAPATARSLLGRAGIPILLGVNLITRIMPQIQGEIAFASVLVIIAVLGIAVSAFIVLLSQDWDKTLVWGTRFAVAPILILPFLRELNEGAAIALWIGLAAFAFAALASAGNQVSWPGMRISLKRLLLLGAILCMGAFPLTPGFVGRVGLYGFLIQQGLVWFVALLAVTMTLALIPLWYADIQQRNDTTGPGSKPEWLGVGLLFFGTLISGILPFFLAGISDSALKQGNARLLEISIDPSNQISLAGSLLVLFLPFLFAYFLARGWGGVAANLGTSQVRLVDGLELNPLGRAFEGLWGVMSRAIRLALALIELNPIAWIVFFAIWVAVWILNS